MFERSNTGDIHNNTNHNQNERQGIIKMPISSPASNMNNNAYVTKNHSGNDAPPLPPHGMSATANNLYNGNVPTSQGKTHLPHRLPFLFPKVICYSYDYTVHG